MPRRAETRQIRRLSDSACGMPHGFPVHGDILPCSYKDQLLSNSLLGSGADIVHEPWHSKLPRFDPAYLHQKTLDFARNRVFFFTILTFSSKRVIGKKASVELRRKHAEQKSRQSIKEPPKTTQRPCREAIRLMPRCGL